MGGGASTASDGSVPLVKKKSKMLRHDSIYVNKKHLQQMHDLDTADGNSALTSPPSASSVSAKETWEVNFDKQEAAAGGGAAFDALRQGGCAAAALGSPLPAPVEHAVDPLSPAPEAGCYAPRATRRGSLRSTWEPDQAVAHARLELAAAARVAGGGDGGGAMVGGDAAGHAAGGGASGKPGGPWGEGAPDGSSAARSASEP